MPSARARQVPLRAGQAEVGAEPTGESELELPERSSALEGERMVSGEQAFGCHPGQEVLLGKLEVGWGRGASTHAANLIPAQAGRRSASFRLRQ